MRIQLIAIFVSLSFLGFIVELVRKEIIREAYAILWLFISIVFVVLSVWRNGLDYIGELVGIAYSPTALILILLMGVFLILIQFSIVISRHTEKIKQLTQELALLAVHVKEDSRKPKKISD